LAGPGSGQVQSGFRHVLDLGRGLIGFCWRRPARRFFFLTLIPTVIVFLYTALWASPMYISTSMFAIRDAEASGGSAGLSLGGLDLSRIFSGTNSGSTTGDSYLVAKYVQSWDIFSKLDAALDLKTHYSDRQKDVWSRLPRDVTQADLLDYWEQMAQIDFDPDTGIVTCTVRAYAPEMAWRINQMIIEASEALVNEMNDRGQQDALSRAAGEVRRAEERLTAAHAGLRQMRDQTALLDSRSAAEALQTIVTSLEVEAAKVAAELNEARSYMREDSPAVEALQRRWEALNVQLTAERGKLSGLSAAGAAPVPTSGVEHLSAIAGRFEDLQLEEEFARQQYSSAMALLESARVQSEMKNRYLVAFEPPLLPHESLYPLVIRSTILTFIGAALVIAMLSLIIASIKEHAGF
jgi:capsular polysaccharide transport system permease protein